MKVISTSRKRLGVTVGRTAAALAVACIVGSVASLPAWAGHDDNGGHGRGHRAEHEDHRRGDWHESDRWNEREWRRYHPNVHVAPGYGYAPPPVAYAPIPVQPSLNLIFPLDLR
jgi:hypothetical protein